MNDPGFKRGLYFGGAAIATYLIVYIISKKALILPGIWPITGIILPIAFMVYAARDKRSEQDGLMTFREALKTTYLTYVVGSLIFNLFKYVMTTMIDPSLLPFLQEGVLEFMEQYPAYFPEEQLDILRDSIDEEESVGIGSLLYSWIIVLIFPGFVYSLIISANTKRNAVA